MTDWIGITLALILFFFSALLALRRFFPWISCVLCAAVMLTWLVLIPIYILGHPVGTIMALLIAQSAVGGMYAFQKKVPRPFLVFRLAYLCTALVACAWIAGVRIGSVAPLLLAGVWVVSGVLFFAAKEGSLRRLAERVIACCKDW